MTDRTVPLTRAAVVTILALGAGCRGGGGAGRPSRATWTVPPPIVVRGVGFEGPRAVVHDPDQDVYFVSNLGTAASPGGAGSKGFISVVSYTGTVLALKWIDGGRGPVTLNAPAGMAISGGFLFVADIDVVRRFDRKSGAPSGEIPIPGAVSLQGMSSTADGAIYFTDSGLPGPGDGSSPNGAGGVYRVSPDGRLDTLMVGPALDHPTGVAVTGDSVWVVTRSGELYRIADGRREDAVKFPQGGVNGLVLFNGEAFVSSEDARAILRGKLGGPLQPLLGDLDAPALLGHDIWRNRILVPLPRANEVQIVRLAF